MPASLQHLSFWAWVEPSILIPIAALAALYYVAVDSPLGARVFGPPAPEERRRRWMAYTAFVLLYVSFGGPLDVLADSASFAAHMMQHTLGTMVCAPLFLAGAPVRFWERLLKTPVLGTFMRIFAQPVMALVVFNVVLGLTIWPRFYDLIEVDNTLHLIAHAALFVSAVFMWWPVVSRAPSLPRLHPGLRMLYMFLDGMPMIFTMTFPTLDTALLYPYYAHAPILWGMSHITEQQLGGALMITLMHIAYGTAFVVAFIELKNRTDQGRIDPILTVIRPAGATPPRQRVVGGGSAR